MAKNLFKVSALLIVMAVILSSCGKTTAESKLIGTWKANKVETDFDEQFTTPEMLKQVVEMQKETYFEITSDSTLLIVSPGSKHETTWKLDHSNQAISYFFEGNPNYVNKLGTLKDGKIVSESKTPLGIITIYFEQE